MSFAFTSIAEFFAMGGHGLYVWLSYGATYLVLAGLLWVSLRGHRRQLRELAATARRDAANRAAYGDEHGNAGQPPASTVTEE